MLPRCASLAGSDQNDENRCGREQTHPAAWYCPPGSSERREVSANQYTFCCAVENADCPTAQIIACSEDQRHYEGDCPPGFTCQNGKPVTIKWRDDNNIGQCFANDITKPNIGQNSGDVEEGATGALFHLSGQVQRTSGITATTSSGDKYIIDTKGFETNDIVYYTSNPNTYKDQSLYGVPVGSPCSGLTASTFYKVASIPQAGQLTLTTLAGGAVVGIVDADSTTWGVAASTCGNLQVWGDSAAGIRALNGVGNIITNKGDYNIISQNCLDPISTELNHWTTKFESLTNDIYLQSKIPLVYSGVG